MSYVTYHGRSQIENRRQRQHAFRNGIYDKQSSFWSKHNAKAYGKQPKSRYPVDPCDQHIRVQESAYQRQCHPRVEQ